MDKIETVANNDERKLVGQFGLFEEVLNLLRVVVVAFAADALNLANLAGTRSSLDVLEMDLRIVTQIHDRTGVVVQACYGELAECGTVIVTLTFEALETLEHLDELDRSKDIRVLGRNLDDNLQVLADVDFEHFLHAGHRLLSGKIAEVVHKPLQQDQPYSLERM